jgi:hypothetical protein
MNRVLLKPVYKACGVYFNIPKDMVSWTLLGLVLTLRNTVVHSEIQRSAQNGFVYFVLFSYRLSSYTALIVFNNLSRLCLLRGTN